ncbi:MAG TPA: response regulator transcription factor [Actinomycetota bacterium]|nr:response regulator transcription factor [Actinomycetota bacterium]
MALRVVMAEDNYLIREGVRELLASDPDVDVVASCGDMDSLLEAVAREKPDVVLTDIRMPPTETNEGIRASEKLRDTDPDLGVVVLSQYDEPDYALALLERGARGRGYLLKQRVSDLDQLVAALREVARGGSVIDPLIVEGLVAARSKAASPLDQLTAREREVLSEMAQGKNNAAIAAALTLTERAIERHINSIFSKLGLTQERDVHRRVKAVLLFLAENPG